MILLDSNVYIRSFNDETFGTEFRAFHQAALPQLALSAVVLTELLVGANSPAREKVLRRTIVEPFQARKRIHVPTRQTWELSAEVDRRIRALGSFAASLAQRGFFNDILIAASARELGGVVVTQNVADFTLIQRVLDFQFRTPWPSLP
ncbi:MAG: type II toxin-antitoxin system VapC family toxin [Rubrobacteraceae bacterium]|nr:type II toxin-antitoxin system VapC family toxin [Rubrobacteraceae bacterium]